MGELELTEAEHAFIHWYLVTLGWDEGPTFEQFSQVLAAVEGTCRCR